LILCNTPMGLKSRKSIQQSVYLAFFFIYNLKAGKILLAYI
jgi:hypothetical protein